MLEKEAAAVAPAGAWHGGEARGLRANAVSIPVAQAAQDGDGSSWSTSATFAEESGDGAGDAKGGGAQARQG